MNNQKFTSSQAVNMFMELAIHHSDAAEKSNYKKANKLFDKLEKLFKQFRYSPSVTEEILISLLNNDDLRVRAQAAMKCLSVNLLASEAVNVLEEAEQQRDFRILRVDAHMALKVWRESDTFSTE